MVKNIKKITIVGVGLIGGSIGLAVKKRRVAHKVIGVFRRQVNLDLALKMGVVDEGTLDIGLGVSDADLVIIATPVSMISIMARKAAPFMKRGAIITDAGSVKRVLVDDLTGKLPGSVHFVGSHPMAGSEKTGMRHASADLFKDALTIVTKTKMTRASPLGAVVRFWKALGARVMVTTPAEHDRRVALVSHLPHAIAQSLCLVLDADSAKAAAGGFRDTTRIAASDPYMWADIFIANRKELLRSLAAVTRDLETFRRALLNTDYRKVLARAIAARDIRGRVG